MEIDLLRKMANVWEVLERHTDTNHLLASFCRRQKNINGQIAFLCSSLRSCLHRIRELRGTLQASSRSSAVGLILSVDSPSFLHVLRPSVPPPRLEGRSYALEGINEEA